MPSPQILDAIAERAIQASEDADRERFRDLIRSALLCLFWAAVGLFCVAWSVHTTDVAYGKMAFFAGLGLGNGGIAFTLAAAYIRGERRGDW